MNDPEAVLVAAVVGAAALLLTAFVSVRESARARAQEALEWMTGDTQRRNVGLAAIEALWVEPGRARARRLFDRLNPSSTSPQFRRLVIPVLCGSAMYLLSTSGQKQRPHGLYNLERIMKLLCSELKPSDLNGYLGVVKALRYNCHRTPAQAEEKDAGLIVDADKLNLWDEQLTVILRTRGGTNDLLTAQGAPCPGPSRHGQVATSDPGRPRKQQ